MMIIISILMIVVLKKLTNGSDLYNFHMVGGRDADIKYHPYQLSIHRRGSFICGASIISTNWALTAAHCARSPANTLTLRAGSSNPNLGGTVHAVDKKISHQLFNDDTMDYDIALLRVSTPFVFGAGVAAIKLPTPGQNTAEKSTAIVSGWGSLWLHGPLSDVLQVAYIPVISTPECQTAYQGSSVVTARMICTRQPGGGVDACKGDSGGPMMINGTLIGIISWGDGCADAEHPGVYTKISSLIGWITKNSGVK